MMIGVGMAAMSAMMFNPFGVAAGVGLYSAGADRVATKEAGNRQAGRPKEKDSVRRRNEDTNDEDE